MKSQPYNPRHPTRPVPIARQAACLALAADKHGMGYWSYLARFSDNASYATAGWPDIWTWFDLPEALLDAAETMALVAELARYRGEARFRSELIRAVERERAHATEPGESSGAPL